jgi:hypothetical protein
VIDLYQVYWLDTETPIIETARRTLGDLRRERKIRAIGVTKFSLLKMDASVRSPSATPCNRRVRPTIALFPGRMPPTMCMATAFIAAGIAQTFLSITHFIMIAILGMPHIGQLGSFHSGGIHIAHARGVGSHERG